MSTPASSTETAAQKTQVKSVNMVQGSPLYRSTETAAQEAQVKSVDMVQGSPLHRSTETAAQEAQVKSTDEMEAEALAVSKNAVLSNNVEKDIAQFIKKEFDQKHGNTWHCIVGRNFGSFITHETKHFIYFYVGNLAVLLFKTA